MSGPTGNSNTQSIEHYHINSISADDLRDALVDGIKDFGRRPYFSSFFGLVYSGFGVIFVTGLIVLDQLWMIAPAVIGFPLIAPFLAAGLYEMSRRYAAEEDFSWRDIFFIIFQQQRREFGWMAFVVLFVFLVWFYQVRLLLSLFFHWQSFSSLSGFFDTLATSNGIMFLAVGSAVGSFLAIVLFSLTVIAMPLLLDEDIDFLSAMMLSIRSVLTNPLVMLLWGVTTVMLVFFAMLPLFMGLIVILPILGHATWHLYKRVIGTVEPM